MSLLFRAGAGRLHSFALALATAAGLLLAGAAATADKPAATTAAPPTRPSLTVSLTQPQRGSMAQSVQAGGTIHAWQEAVVGAEGSGWRLAEVHVNVGDVVRRGQLLATFATELPRAELAQMEALVAEAEATLAEAIANAQRARDLQSTGVLSAQAVTQLLTQESTAKARLQAQRAVLKVQQLRLAQARVLAPDNGVISSRTATVGAVVGAGTELFRLIRQGRLEWRAEVAATDLGRLANGQQVQVQPVGSAALAGRVRMVAPTLDAQSRNGLVYVDLLGALPPQQLLAATSNAARSTAAAAPVGATAGAPKAGMYARGEFLLGSTAALTLPQSAVLLRDGFSYVFTLGAADRVTQTKVQVGRRTGDRIEITGGLDAGARVVASGAGFLSDGDTVRVVAAAAPAAAAPGATASAAR
jgi:RND family efflux transporter MFP subunit